MLAIILLIVGIVGFVKGRINISKTRELRGGGMYAVCTLFCLPFPLTLFLGFLIGIRAGTTGTPIDQNQIMMANLGGGLIPIIIGIILAYVLAKPKQTVAGPRPQGFEVKMDK
jgi:hypothetical protein